jgi:hypothetical protein
MGFILDRFETVLPLAASWAAEQQQRILREGVPLSEEEIADAKAAGVQHPEHVRLLRVHEIPFPPHPLLRLARTAIGLLSLAPRGLTLQHGIFVRSDYWRDRPLIVHELVHTAQYERLGGIVPFLRRYLRECGTIGYSKSSMEQEAVATAARICSK